MSLLMDALKRAENSKLDKARAAAGEQSPGNARPLISLEPLLHEPAGSQGLPDLAPHLEAVDADLASTLTLEAERNATPPLAAPPEATPPAIDPASREAARNAFTAKDTAMPARRQPLGLVLGALGLAGVAIGAYFWHQLNTLNHNALAPQTAPLAPTAPPSATPPAPVKPATPAVLTPSDRSTAENGTKTALFAPRHEQAPARSPATARESPVTAPIRLTRTRPEIDAGVAQAYASLQRGNLEAARREFEQALQRDPNNVDALLAMAALAQHEGRPAEAEAFRQQAMVANPGDTTVQAALLNGVTGEADPQAAESRLKMLLSSQPDAAPLNFALGNLYARQGRWDEAQPAYFNAVAADGDNPDYLFNLAVSLDHLRQPRLAARHYQLALDAAGKRPAAFDRDGVQRRLSELAAAP